MAATTTQPRRSQATAASPPSWEVLQLISQSMDDDPKSLAVACCVSKSWHAVFASDRLWKRLCRSLYPSSAHSAAAAISPRHLFRLLHTASLRRLRRRRRVPSPLRLSLSRLHFFLDIFQRGAPVLSLLRAGSELVAHHDIFRFAVPIGGEEAVVLDAREELKVVWTVATSEWREAFALMEFEGQGKPVGNREIWFSEKLPCPSPCFCSDAEASCIEAQVFVELSGEVPGGGDGDVAGGGSAYRRVEKVSFGLMNTKTWRYTNLKDGLLYLQHFLLEEKTITGSKSIM